MTLSPVVLFAYNRPAHTRRTLEALAATPEAARSTLYVFCDGPKPDATAEDRAAIAEVRCVVRERAWCGTVEVLESDENRGLAASIVGGVSDVLERHDRVVVLEDDIIVSEGFLTYMNEALSCYANDDRVLHVGGYLPRMPGRGTLPETFFLPVMLCWGWGTWRRAWHHATWEAADHLRAIDDAGERDRFDIGVPGLFSGQLEANVSGDLRTWAISWYASVFRRGGLCLYPCRALVRNIGTDGSGVHFTTDQTARYDVDLASGVDVRRQPLRVSARALRRLTRFYRYGPETTWADVARLRLGLLKHRAAKALASARSRIA